MEQDADIKTFSGVATLTRIPVKLIELTLAAAPVEKSGLSRMAKDWDGANRIVTEWAETMPRERLSCDFKAMFDDGFTYSGTLEFGMGRGKDIVGHIDSLMHTLMSDDPSTQQWRKFIDPDGSIRTHMTAIREHYDLGSSPVASLAAPAPK